VVCGTDTLGVGINGPSAPWSHLAGPSTTGAACGTCVGREFHQIAGRAGRAGTTPVGEVIVLAPEHVIENRKQLERAGDDPKKLRNDRPQEGAGGRGQLDDKD